MTREQVRELAARAMNAVIREDWDAARTAMLELGRSDPVSRALALMMFCDTAISAQRTVQGLAPLEDGEAVAGTVRPGWLSQDTGTLELDADAVSPELRWAGQLVAARAAKDADAFSALLSALPRDGRERGRYAAALLGSCAGIAKVSRAGQS